MPRAVKPIPEGYHSVTPYLILRGAADALEFYKRAFGAKEIMRMDAPNGRIGHAEIRIGDSAIMLADEFPDMGTRAPQTPGSSPVMLYLYVEDVDKTVKTAIGAGAKAVKPVEDQFYGDRSGSITDPFGHTWFIATHKEDVPPDELRKRAEQHLVALAARDPGGERVDRLRLVARRLELGLYGEAPSAIGRGPRRDAKQGLGRHGG